MSKRTHHRTSHQKGFTLIELLIVISIMGVVTAIAVPTLLHFMGRGKSEAYDADVSTLQTLVNTYRLDFGCMPTADGGGGDRDSSYIVFAGFIGNVDANGHR